MIQNFYYLLTQKLHKNQDKLAEGEENVHPMCAPITIDLPMHLRKTRGIVQDQFIVNDKLDRHVCKSSNRVDKIKTFILI